MFKTFLKFEHFLLTKEGPVAGDIVCPRNPVYGTLRIYTCSTISIPEDAQYNQYN